MGTVVGVETGVLAGTTGTGVAVGGEGAVGTAVGTGIAVGTAVGVETGVLAGTTGTGVAVGGEGAAGDGTTATGVAGAVDVGTTGSGSPQAAAPTTNSSISRSIGPRRRSAINDSPVHLRASGQSPMTLGLQPDHICPSAQLNSAKVAPASHACELERADLGTGEYPSLGPYVCAFPKMHRPFCKCERKGAEDPEYWRRHAKHVLMRDIGG